jgi:ADP-heptose:LPS heptosyltransferase
MPLHAGKRSAAVGRSASVEPEGLEGLPVLPRAATRLERPPRVNPARWAGLRQVLCVRLDTIGDVLMTGPAMRALGQRARVTLLTSPAGAAVAELMPEVDETIVHTAAWLKAPPPGAVQAALGQPELELIERLRGYRFDAAAIFTVYSQSALPAALFCLLAGIPLRLAHSRENPYALLSDWVPEPEPRRLVRHEVRRQLDLVAAVGARTANEDLRLGLPAQARAHATALLRQRGVQHRRWVAVHAGASAPARTCPPELMAEACRILERDHRLTLVLTGDEHDHAYAEEVMARVGSGRVSLVGALNLAELAAVIEAAPVLLCGNTGPAHLASAVSTPVVDLYALTNPQHTPWRVRSAVLYRDVPCRWCYSSVCPEGHHMCLRGIEPAAIARAVVGLLEERPSMAASLGT